MRGDGVRVLVVGAGIAGLSVARALRGWSGDVEVVDRQPGVPREGTGIFLQGNAVRALDSLGLARQVLDRSAVIVRQRTHDARGRLLFEVPTAVLWGGIAPSVALPRSGLHRILLDGAGTRVQWGRTLEAVRAHDEGVDVTLDGRTARYDLVIGADGIHSAVRHLVFGPATVHGLGQRAHRFVVPDPLGAASAPGDWCARLGDGSALLTMPLRGQRLYGYLDAAVGDARPVPELLSGFAGQGRALAEALTAAGGEDVVHSSDLEEVLLGSWSTGGVLLVGDAAHAAAPSMAQEAAMAFEDAIVLRACLRAATELRAALEAFEVRRRPRTDWVRQQAHRRDRARALPPRVRDVVLRRFGAAFLRSNVRPLRDPP